MTPSQQGISTNRRNQRRSRRQVAKGSTRAKAYSNALGLGRNIAAGVLDVSEGGARLILTEHLAEATEFQVIFESAGVVKPVKMVAIVVWSVEAADGTFVVGTQFQKSMEYGVLQALARS